MSKEKIQGTNFETWTLKQLLEAGIPAKRLPEGGSKDEGDLEAIIHEQRWVIECKARQQLSIQQTLGKARQKAQGLPVMVWWKRIIPSAGKTTRQPVGGERVIVALSEKDFLTALDNAYKQGVQDGTAL